MGRIKPPVKKIESLQDANLVLKEIGLLESELDAIDSAAHKRIFEKIIDDCIAERKARKEKKLNKQGVGKNGKD